MQCICMGSQGSPFPLFFLPLSQKRAMSTNRHALIRYRTIDRCLRQRNKRFWTWQELAAACGEELREFEGVDRDDPSERTIKGDLSFMRNADQGYGAPIQWYPGEQAYAYSEPGFSITQLPLDDADMAELGQALSILRQFRGFPQVEGVEKVAAKLSEALRVQKPSAPQVLQFEDNMVGQGLQWLDLLYRACRDRRCVALDYHPFQVPEGYQHRRIVSPQLLKEYNNRWFLFACDHRRHGIRTYALDRIREAAFYPLADYVEDRRFEPADYFRHTIGVSRKPEDEVQEVRIRVQPGQVQYLLTKPLHASQQQQPPESNGSVVFIYQLTLNVELENLLLSFGEWIEVLSPESLRQKIAERARRQAEQYRPAR